MNIRTKVISTIIAMACSLSVSATGIAAIAMDFPIQVANSKRLVLGEVQGNLWGGRIGANNFDFDRQNLILLYKNGEGAQETAIELFCSDVNFSTGSKQIEYLFVFVLAEDSAGAAVKLTNCLLTNDVNYEVSYKFGRGQGDSEPDWNTASDMIVDEQYFIEQAEPYIYLRATINVKDNVVSRIDTSAVWSFTYEFDGVAVEG